MSSSTRQDDESAHDLHALALSTSQIQACILGCHQLFSKRKESHLLKVARFARDASHTPSTQSFTSSSQLSAYFDNNPNDADGQSNDLEIYTVHQKDTWAPLNISSDMISLLMDRYHLSPGFLQILTCFKDRHLPTEEGFSSASQSHFTDKRSEFGWVFKYSEQKAVTTGNPWRIRQTGIYHFADQKRARSTLFIIHPSPTAHFDAYLHQVLQQPDARLRLLSNPMLVHSMLISTHLSSWRDYLGYHEAKLLQLDMKPACTSLTQSLVTFETLKEVRAVENKILPLEPILVSFEKLMKDLEEANSVFSEVGKVQDGTSVVIKAALRQFRKDATSYRRQVLYMNKRAQLTTQSMLDTLNLSQSKNTFDMGRSAREDSVAIRAITLVTSFYLPFSFVATMFGMNLVDFDSESRNLVLSKQLWLYFVISVPLTALTLACWKWRMRMYRDGDINDERRSTVKVKPLKRHSDIEMGHF